MEDDSLTDQELEATKEFLTRVNEVRRQHGAENELSFKTAVKFMMARKFTVDRALQLYQQHEFIRFREKLTKFDPTSESFRKELSSGKFTVLPTRDANESRIVMFTVHKHNPPKDTKSHEITLQAMVYQLDVAMEDMKTQRSGLVFIYNMMSSKYSNFDYELSQKILNLLKGAYPAKLKKVLIVMAPLWFKAPFKILRLFVREKLRDRVLMVNFGQLPNHVPKQSLPAELGGLYRHDHTKWLKECEKTTAEISQDSLKGGLADLAFKNHYLANSSNSSSPILMPFSNGAIRNVGSSGLLDDFDDDDDDSSAASSGVLDGLLIPNPCNVGTIPNALSGHLMDEREHQTSTSPTPQLSPGKRAFLKHKPEKIIMPSSPNHERNGSSQSNHGKDLSPDRPECLHLRTDPGMTVGEFVKYMKEKGKRGLQDEYEEIKSEPLGGSFETARQRENQSKNRYTDVLCFDHSRVKIPIDPDEAEEEDATDYINANYVDGYEQPKAFISTQGPLPRTFADFWRMIWQEMVVVIVMTTRTVERCRQKCGQYWPLESTELLATEEYGEIKVTNIKVDNSNSDYVITTLIVSKKGEPERTVTHMIFNSWPDYGVPPSALGMLEFRDKIRSVQKNMTELLAPNWFGHPKGPPIVVHCSAGIGRTGTFMTLDICLQRLEDTGKVDVKSTVEKIRSQRAHSIQMPDQYVFCYLAILEYLMSRGLLQDGDMNGFEDDDDDIEEE